MNYVSFPGLGIQPFQVNPVAFTIFGIDVMWYGVIITCGMLLAYLYGLTRAKIERVRSEDITDLTLFLVIFGVIGARLYYVVFKLDEFIKPDQSLGETLKAMVNLRNGGLAIYGGIIAGFITALVVARVKRIRFPVLADIVAPCLLIGQSIGRWGNFVNVEAYGSATDLPWRMGVGQSGGAPFVHPTFLYESLWNVVGFILIAIFYKKKKFHGQVFLFYGIWYGIGRAWIEGLRTDSLMLGPVRVSQILSIVIVVAFAVLMALGIAKAPRVVRVRADAGAGSAAVAEAKSKSAESSDEKADKDEKEDKKEESPSEDAPDEKKEEAPNDDAPDEKKEEAPNDDAPEDKDDAPVEDAPAEDAPEEDAPAEEAPVDEAPAEEAPAEEAEAPETAEGEDRKDGEDN